MKIAVIIVNWDSGRLLERCLGVLATQRRQPDRIIVMDNGSSTNDCVEVVSKYPSVHLVRLGVNTGFAEANNRAVNMVRDCDWIALLNPDAFPEPGWLEALERAALANPGFASFASQLRVEGRSGVLDGMGDAYHVSGLAWRRSHGLRASQQSLESGEVFSACAAAAMYRLEAFLEAGGFDGDYFCYMEDVDLGFRLRLLGHRCLYVADAVVHHVGSAVAGVRSDFAVYHGHRNLVWTYYKNMPRLLVWLYLPQHLMINVAALAWFTARGQGATIFKAKWHALRRIAWVHHRRRQVQATRVVSAMTLRRSMARGWLLPYSKLLVPITRSLLTKTP